MSITARERLLREVLEKNWTTEVVALAKKCGWLVHHSRPAMNKAGRWATWLQGEPGLPDLILLRPPRLIVAELKRQHRATTTEHQERWLEAFRSVPGCEVYLWKPSDADRVLAILQRTR